MASVVLNAHVPKLQIVGTATEKITIGELCKQFIYSKRVLSERGGIIPALVDVYEKVCERLRLAFGSDTPVDELKPMHFTQLHESLPKNWGPARLSREIQQVRTIFKYAYDAGLIDRPARFGSDFRKPAQILFRRARWLRGPQMFEADEIRKLLAAARPDVQALILLGINCAFGNSDCTRLTLAELDLVNGWVNFPRPKTEVDRRCKLWPETIAAIHRAIRIRFGRAQLARDARIFSTRKGREWAAAGGNNPLSKLFLQLMKRAGVHRAGGPNFYGLRRTFETIGGESLDQPAVDKIMGHTPRSDDMAAVYRQRIKDERLVRVTDYVRAWLFPPGVENPIKAHRRKAAALFDDWTRKPRLSRGDLRHVLALFHLSQSELARGIGRSVDLINAILHGREKLSRQCEHLIRWYVGTEGGMIIGQPEEIRPAGTVDDLSDVLLPDDIQAGLRRPLIDGDVIRALGTHLRRLSINKKRLAKLWGYDRKVFEANRKRPVNRIGLEKSNRLRALFGVPPVAVGPRFCPEAAAPSKGGGA